MDSEDVAQCKEDKTCVSLKNKIGSPTFKVGEPIIIVLSEGWCCVIYLPWLDESDERGRHSEHVWQHLVDGLQTNVTGCE